MNRNPTCILCILLSFSTSILCAQSRCDLSILKEEIPIGTWNSWTDIPVVNHQINGLLLTYDEENKIIAQRRWKEDHPVGKTRIYYPNGTLRWEVNYEDSYIPLKEFESTFPWAPPYTLSSYTGIRAEFGVPDGWALNFDKKGNPISKVFYTHGVLNGQSTHWYLINRKQQVNKREEGTYRDGLKHGKWTNWGTTGFVTHTAEYKYGKLHGKTQTYNGYGNLDETAEYKEGILHGTLTRHYYSGNTKSLTPYREGIKQGKERMLFQDGTLAGDKHWKDGELSGPTRSFHPAGNLSQWGWYKKGQRDSLWREWDSEGKLTWIGHYREGKKIGAHKHWYENGRLHQWMNYKDGQLHGSYQQWYINGQRDLEGQYENGLEEGEFIYWTREGRKAESVFYEKGVEIRRTVYLKDWYPWEIIEVEDEPAPLIEWEEELLPAPEPDPQSGLFQLLSPGCVNWDQVYPLASGKTRKYFKQGFTGKVLLDKRGVPLRAETVSAVPRKHEAEVIKCLLETRWTPAVFEGKAVKDLVWIRIEPNK